MVTAQLAGTAISMPAPAVAMLTSSEAQLFSLLPAVQVNPAATAITPRITGSARLRYRAAGYASTSDHASSPRPASTQPTNCAFTAVAPGGWTRKVSTPTRAKPKARIDHPTVRGVMTPSIACLRSPGRRGFSAWIRHLPAPALPPGVDELMPVVRS